MSPSITLDNDSDFNPTFTTTATNGSAVGARTLLLAPPSIASHEEALRHALATFDRAVTDVQMLDRLSAGLLILPITTYDRVVILEGADGTRTEAIQLLSRDIFAKLLLAMKAGCELLMQNDSFNSAAGEPHVQEAILAGLMPRDGVMYKPDDSASVAVPLKLRRKGKPEPETAAPITTFAVNGSPNANLQEQKIAGVGFVDFSDDFGVPIISGEDDDDDELIDEDTLLTEEDLKRPVNIPPECAPRVGKRRRACKDCTCGLAERLQAEDAAIRSNADAKLKTFTLAADDLTEVDFTIKGKVGSCGNCSLGDAFRCDGCPYIGMPAFKPGEEVMLLNNDVQL